MTEAPEVVVVQRVLPHYRVPVFRRMRELYPRFRVVYGRPFRGEPTATLHGASDPWLVRRSNVYFKRSPICYATDLRGVLTRGSTVVVNAELGNLNLPALFALRRLRGFSLVLWTFGFDPERGFDPEARMEDRARRFFYERADAVVFYWDRGKSLVEEVTGSRPHFFVAPNTLDTDPLVRLRGELETRGLRSVRRELGIETRSHFVYVGRLVADKEVDRLVRAWIEVEKSDADASLTIVGAGPEEGRLRDLARESGARRIGFAGEVTDPERVGKLLFASDALVIPGRLGLAVIQAFCFGTPVVSQAKAGFFHGEGIGYVEPGENGILVRDGSLSDLAAAILSLASDEGKRRAMGAAAAATVPSRGSIDHMLAGMRAAIAWASGRR